MKWEFGYDLPNNKKIEFLLILGASSNNKQQSITYLKIANFSCLASQFYFAILESTLIVMYCKKSKEHVSHNVLPKLGFSSVIH